MADLTMQSPPGHADRAQLLLVSALGLAALLVVLALILNTVIYTENEAARESAALEASELLRTQQAAIDLVDDMIAAENAGGQRPYTQMETNLTEGVAAWSELHGRQAAVSTQRVEIDIDRIEFGTRIVQDVFAALENAYGLEDWYLVEGFTEVRTFQLTVDRTSLVNVAGNDSNATVLAGQNVFSIAVQDGPTRQAFVYEDAGAVVVGVADSSGTITGRCTASGLTATIDLVNETVGGADCTALAGFLVVGGPADLQYRNGGSAEGEYLIVVDDPALDDDLFAPGYGGTPRAERLVYEVSISYDVSGHAITYDAVVDGITGGGR